MSSETLCTKQCSVWYGDRHTKAHCTAPSPVEFICLYSISTYDKADLTALHRINFQTKLALAIWKERRGELWEMAIIWIDRKVASESPSKSSLTLTRDCEETVLLEAGRGVGEGREQLGSHEWEQMVFRKMVLPGVWRWVRGKSLAVKSLPSLGGREEGQYRCGSMKIKRRAHEKKSCQQK